MSHLLRHAKKVTAQDLSHLDANMKVAVIKFMFLFTTCTSSCFKKHHVYFIPSLQNITICEFM